MSGKDTPQMFTIKDADSLRKLDNEGKEIQSRLNYDLTTRSKRFEPLQPQLPMNGMYSYAAFMLALEATVKWKIVDEHLELNDFNDALVARFE